MHSVHPLNSGLPCWMSEGVCLIKRLLPSFNEENEFLGCKAFLVNHSMFNAAYIILEHLINVEMNITWIACHLSCLLVLFSRQHLCSQPLYSKSHQLFSALLGLCPHFQSRPFSWNLGRAWFLGRSSPTYLARKTFEGTNPLKNDTVFGWGWLVRP